MPITLMPLPYAEDALAPEVSADTLQVHHGKHHKTYVDKVNAAIEGTAHSDKSLEDIVAAARAGDKGLFNNAAQAWNHGFYWNSLTPDTAAPTGELSDALARDFGSVAKAVEELVDRGTKHFASGWVWLAAEGGKLSVEETHDGDTLADAAKTPLLVIDLWEHAYYLDRKNERPKYLAAVTEKLLNWEFAASQLAGNRWTYPA
jgi:superoxide dismutase, Fe-Mn family